MTARVFIDTSAFYALMDSSDAFNRHAEKLWTVLLDRNVPLSTTNYIILETAALLQNRLGFEAAEVWYRDVLGVVDVRWVGKSAHRVAYELWLTLGRRKLSLVDCVSFVNMRQDQIEIFFGFDKHFEEQGFIAFKPS